MTLTKQELVLVHFVKALPFVALLDAGNGIEKEAEKAGFMALKLEVQGNPNAEGFKLRASELKQLAELLGAANADYRNHIFPPEERTAADRGVIQMIESNATEVVQLFDVMKKYGATCSLEFKAKGSLDPLIGISSAKVGVDYFADSEQGYSLIIELDEASFSFEPSNHSFSKYVSDCQIDVCIVSNDDGYSAWFSSSVVPPEGIKEANSYVKHDDPSYTDSELSEEARQRLTTYFINVRDGRLADCFEQLADHARNGWAIESIEDNVGNDGQYRFNLIREGSEL